MYWGELEGHRMYPEWINELINGGKEWGREEGTAFTFFNLERKEMSATKRLQQKENKAAYTSISAK